LIGSTTLSSPRRTSRPPTLPCITLACYKGGYSADYIQNYKNLTWWEENYPTWVLYKKVGDGYYPAVNWDPGIKLDVTNPEVVAWQAETFGEPCAQAGFDAIAADVFQIGCPTCYFSALLPNLTPEALSKGECTPQPADCSGGQCYSNARDIPVDLWFQAVNCAWAQDNYDAFGAASYVKDGSGGWREVEPAHPYDTATGTVTNTTAAAALLRNRIDWAKNLRTALHRYRTKKGNKMELVVNTGNAILSDHESGEYFGTVVDTLDFNDTLDSWMAKVPEGSIMRDYIEATGGICDEMGFANWGDNRYGGQQWVRTIKYALLVQKLGTSYHFVNEGGKEDPNKPEKGDKTDPNNPTFRAWIVASYLMAKADACTNWMGVSQTGYGYAMPYPEAYATSPSNSPVCWDPATPGPWPEVAVDLGPPTDPAPINQPYAHNKTEGAPPCANPDDSTVYDCVFTSFAYFRRYTKGVVYVNADEDEAAGSSIYQVTLDTDKCYYDVSRNVTRNAANNNLNFNISGLSGYIFTYCA